MIYASVESFSSHNFNGPQMEAEGDATKIPERERRAGDKTANAGRVSWAIESASEGRMFPARRFSGHGLLLCGHLLGQGLNPWKRATFLRPPFARSCRC